jgi:hypothetical protein
MLRFDVGWRFWCGDESEENGVSVTYFGINERNENNEVNEDGWHEMVWTTMGITRRLKIGVRRGRRLQGWRAGDWARSAKIRLESYLP